MIGSGKLGHGDTSRVYKPKVIEALTGTHIRKVACSGQSSAALTSTGQVKMTQEFMIITCSVECKCVSIAHKSPVVTVVN